MFSGFGQKFGAIIRSFLPVETAIIFLALGVVVWPLPYIGTIAPSFVLASIYYWAIYRPDLFRPFVVFFLGLLSDALNQLPFGLTAFIFLGAYQLSFSQRRFFVGQPFFMLWAGFALVNVISTLLIWLFLSLGAETILAPLPVVMQCVMSIAIFPLPAWVLIRLQRAFLSHG